MPGETNTLDSFVMRTCIVVGIGMSVLLGLLLLWFGREVFLLAFAGILLAVILRSLSDWLHDHTGLSDGWALTAVLLLLTTAFVTGAVFFAQGVAEQVNELLETLPKAVQQAERYLQRYGWGQNLLSQAEQAAEQATQSPDIVGRLTRFISTSLGALASGAIILGVGIFLAIQPDLYTAGIVNMVPGRYRPRAWEVVHTLGETLRRWLLGQLVTMSVIGALTTLGYWLLGLPLALALGLLAALVNFIPYIGPILAAVPAILLALTRSPTQALMVLLLYLVIQTLEGYVLTPLVQQRAVLLPPALTLLTQVLLGVLLGGIGIALATPLLAVAVVLVKMLYLEDVLGDTVQVVG